MNMPPVQGVAVKRRGNASLTPYSHVAAVFVCGAFAFLDLYCTQPLLPLLAHVFRAPEANVGLTVSASTLGVAVSAALLAIFGERVDRKRTIVGAMIVLATVTALAATAHNLLSLAIWRLLQGLLTPGIFIITIAYVTEEWPAQLVPRVMSVYVAGTVFGGFAGRVCGGLVAAAYGWRAMFVALSAAGFAGAWITQRILAPAKSKHLPAPVRESRFGRLAANLRNPRLTATFGIGFCMLFTLVGLFSYVTFYLADAPFRLSTAELSWLFAVYLVGLATTLGAGTILARIGLLHGMLGAVALCLVGAALTLCLR